MCVLFVWQEYVAGDMWKRTESTFTARVMQMLAAKKVLQFRDEYVVIRKPTRQEAELCQARVANVARGIMAYLRGQFPTFSTQMLFRCLHLDCPTHRADDLRKLLRLLGWSSADVQACVLEYQAVWARALAAKEAGSLDRDAWASVVAEVHPPTEVHPQTPGRLKRIVCTMLAFLVSETEAERSFAVERVQSRGRPRLDQETRFAGLKVCSCK